MNLTQLRQRFIDLSNIRFSPSAEGLVKLTVRGHHSTAIIHLQGAHVTSFIPKNNKEVLWLSPMAIYQKGKSIRGGIPICWPWFGSHPKDLTLPQHGFAQISIFEIDEIINLNDGSVKVQLSLQDKSEYQEVGLLNFHLKVQIIIGKNLAITMTSLIDNDNSIPWSEAIHTYLAVENIQNTHLHGLRDSRYYNQLSGQVENQLQDNLYFDKETDRIYKQPDDQLTIFDGNRSLLRTQQTGADSTVIWNPWIKKAKSMQNFPDEGYQKMLCVEAAKLDRKTLHPDATQHSISQKIIPS